jgi:hypothetical protein
VTADEAFEKTGGFGKFQKFQILMNTIGNGADGFFFYAFSFLEKEPFGVLNQFSNVKTKITNGILGLVIIT